MSALTWTAKLVAGGMLTGFALASLTAGAADSTGRRKLEPAIK
jgi:hypothetical protein